MSENNATKMEFQTEARQILHLMVHSLYTHKEVFLRELISNASDALDKLRFEAITNSNIKIDTDKLGIHIKLDKTAKTITISDNGVGMTRQEVIDNIGTIARSGSKAFLEKLTGDQKLDSNLIGQFGVGFYSVFMVASSVKVITKRAGSEEPAVLWESKGENEYTIQYTTKEGHGTDVIVYLKEEESVYCEDWQIKALIKKYSDFIAFPIYLPNEKGKEEIINQTKPIWCRKPSDVTPEQYKEFYQQLGGYDEPLTIIHNRAEGIMEYSSLIYIPSKTPFDIYSFERKHGLKLYVKRVFIMDNCKELLPEYLRFVKGVVDSEDLPLNVSREILQKNPLVDKIKKAIVGKILGKLKELSEKEPATYKKFWLEFGTVLKEGLHIDYENKEILLEIIRFYSSKSSAKDDLVSLKEYVNRMLPDQKEIYYITGESREIVEKSPHLEIFKSKGIEVLYLVDPIDEWIVHDIYSYEGKQLKSITRGDLDLGDLSKDEDEARKKSESKFKKLTERIKNILADKVKEVRLSTRLKDSPACLVLEANSMGIQMERLMKAIGQEVPESKRIFEINPGHPIINNLLSVYNKDPKSQELDEWVNLLYEQSIIAEGQMVPDPLEYSRRINKLLLKATSSMI